MTDQMDQASEAERDRTQLDEQILFARHTYENHQAMIRLADSKAGVILTVLAFLSYTGFSYSKWAIEDLRWDTRFHAVIGAALIISASFFLTGLLATLLSLWRLVAPQFSKKALEHKRDLFSFSGVSSYLGGEAYYRALRSASGESLLETLSKEVYAVACIAEKKLKGLLIVDRFFILTIFSWAVNLLATFVLLYVGRK